MSRTRSSLVHGLGALTLALGGLLLAGCEFGGATHKETRRASAPAATLGAMSVSTHNGGVSIFRVQDSELTIVATLRARTPERLAAMTVVAEQDGDGVLVISPRPPSGGWRSSEGCSLEIGVPAGSSARGVKVRTNNGRIALAGTAGKADLRTSNGRVSVSDHDGEIVVATSNGRVELTDVAGPVDADTSNGSITIRLLPGAPGPLKADTSNGSVTVELGAAFAGDLALKTSNGSIDLPDGWSGASVSRASRRSAQVRIGESGVKSSVTTSNGRIAIRLVRAGE